MAQEEVVSSRCVPRARHEKWAVVPEAAIIALTSVPSWGLPWSAWGRWVRNPVLRQCIQAPYLASRPPSEGRSGIPVEQVGVLHRELDVEPVPRTEADGFALRQHHAVHVLCDVEVEHRHVAERLGEVNAGREPRSSRLAAGRPDVVGAESEQEPGFLRKIGERSCPRTSRDVRERSRDGEPVAPLRGSEVHLRGTHHLPDVGVHRVFVQLVRRSGLDDAAVAQHPDAFAHAERLELVWCRVQHRGSELAVQPLELRAHVVAEIGVEIGQGLVEEQQPRAANEGPADRDALLLASARGLRLAVQDMADAQHLRHFGHPRPDLGAGGPGFPERVGEILEDRKVRIESERLEHHRDAAIGRGDPCDLFPVEHDPPAVRHLQPRDDPKGSGLSGGARAEEAEELPVSDIQIETVERDDRAEPLPYALEAKVSFRRWAGTGFSLVGVAQDTCLSVPGPGRP